MIQFFGVVIYSYMTGNIAAVANDLVLGVLAVVTVLSFIFAINRFDIASSLLFYYQKKQEEAVKSGSPISTSNMNIHVGNSINNNFNFMAPSIGPSTSTAAPNPSATATNKNPITNQDSADFNQNSQSDDSSKHQAGGEREKAK
jgi:Na+/proline symporter